MIYLKLERKPRTINSLLKKLFSVPEEDSITAERTYTDPECTNLECGPGRYRSLDAIVEIVRTYFPRATDKKIFTELFKLEVKLKNEDYPTWSDYKYYKYKVQMINCSDIHRPTVYLYPKDDLCSPSDYKPKVWYSKYTWSDVAKILGFSNVNELLNSYEK